MGFKFFSGDRGASATPSMPSAGRRITRINDRRADSRRKGGGERKKTSNSLDRNSPEAKSCPLWFSTEIEEPLAGVRPFDRYVTRERDLGDI